MNNRGRQRVLAISSGGGHWVELLRLRPALEGHDVIFATVSESYRSDVPFGRFAVVGDATRWSKLRLLRMASRVLRIVLRERPDVVLSTGAAPGYFALLFGRMLGARTVWIDSIANADELSLCGRCVGAFAGLWLTQWPHLAREDGPHHAGAVL